MSGIARDIRFAARRLSARPGFTAIAAFTLAIGIGATTTVFTVVNSVLIRPLPYHEPDALVAVWHALPGLNSPLKDVQISAAQVVTYGDENRSFEEFGAWNVGVVTATGVGEPEELRRIGATYGALQTLGVRPALGRPFSRSDDTPGTPETVILFHDYWQRRHGGDPSVVGRTLTLDSRPREVIGVMPRGFRFVNADADVMTPMRFDRSNLRIGQFNFHAVARLRAGVSLDEANADVVRMIPIWLRSWPEAGPGISKALQQAGVAPRITPLKEDVVGNVRDVLRAVMATIGIVLLVACANVANLLLVRVEGRQQELAVRTALGAGKGRIARELLTESLLLALIGGAGGILLASAAVRLLVAVAPASLPRLGEIGMDTTVLLFALAISLLSALIFGTLPVLRHTRSGATAGLRATGRTASESRERHRVRNTLVIGEVALSLVLLVAAGLMIRTFDAMRAVQPGFTNPGDVQLFRLTIAQGQVREPEMVVRRLQEVRERIAALPGVSHVSFASSAPMEDAFDSHDPLLAQDQDLPGSTLPPVRQFEFVAPGFFSTIGRTILAGRDITWTDVYDRRPVVVVSERVARDTWGDPAAALGKRVREHPESQWREVIGVVENGYENGVHEPASLAVYWPVLMERFWTNPVYVRRAVTFTVRSSRAGTESFMRELQTIAAEVAPGVPVAQVRTLAELYDRSMARTSFTFVMLVIAAAMGLLLGVIGIYGVLAYSVTQRFREIGIRAALGAPEIELKRLFLRDGILLALAGVALGLPAAAILTRLLRGLLFGVTPIDPTTYGIVSMLMIAAAALASYVPARRAARVNPLVALRYE